MLSPSLCAIVRSCSLMGSSTQDATCTNFRLAEWYCTRVDFVLLGDVRGVSPTITGWLEAARTREVASLSCHTPALKIFCACVVFILLHPIIFLYRLL